MKFSDIPAHEHVKERLRTLVDNNRLPHALLLEGPEGVGKFALARALAQYLHCENRINGTPAAYAPHADNTTRLTRPTHSTLSRFLNRLPMQGFPMTLCRNGNPF